MPEVDQKVMRFVEEALKKDPNIQLEELFEGAKEAHASIRELTKRQFNARYPLQVKRIRSQARRGRGQREKGSPSASSPGTRPGRQRAPSDPRETVRQVFLQFATDITGADERKDLVRVLAKVDRYVDQVLKVVAG